MTEAELQLAISRINNKHLALSDPIVTEAVAALIGLAAQGDSRVAGVVQNILVANTDYGPIGIESGRYYQINMRGTVQIYLASKAES